MFVSGSGGQFKEICGRARCTKAIQDTAESLPTLWLSFSTALSFEAYQSLHEGKVKLPKVNLLHVYLIATGMDNFKFLSYGDVQIF